MGPTTSLSQKKKKVKVNVKSNRQTELVLVFYSMSVSVIISLHNLRPFVSTFWVSAMRRRSKRGFWSPPGLMPWQQLLPH